MAITRHLRRLARFHDVGNAGIDGIASHNGDLEAVLHEACHLVTLGIDHSGVNEHGQSILETLNSRGSDALSNLASDWDEIKVLACEVRVLRLARLAQSEAEFIRDNATSVQWRHYDDDRALVLIERAVQTKAALKRARVVIRRLQKMASALPSARW